MEVYSENLAKLLAAENIKVELKRTSTAYFDVVKRKMVFPDWILKLPIASRELLMLHEASHALHTPEFGTHEAAKDYEIVFRTIMNILEDKRIEDAMKEKYPGSKSTFIRGFYELVNMGLFGIDFNENADNFSLIDRMNLHFKGDYYFQCKFTEEEQYWVDRAANNKTFEDVYQNAIDLLEYMKETYAEEAIERWKKDLSELDLDNVTIVPKDSFDDDYETIDEDFSEEEHQNILEKIKEQMTDDEISELEEMIQSGNEEGAKEKIKDAIDKDKDNTGFDERNAGKTDQNWEEAQEDLSRELSEEQMHKGMPVNLGFPKQFNYKDFVVDNTLCHKILSEDFHTNTDKLIEKYHNFVRDYKKDMNPILSHMIREFFRKQAAEDYRRTKQSKTGNLDLRKLPHYRYESDLFLNKQISYDEKNHGFVLLLDWSGSMTGFMTNAILQLINNVMFCKAIAVPFIAYAFSTEVTDNPDHPLPHVFHEYEEGDFRIKHDMKLLELLDSTKSNYEEQLRNLFYLAFSHLSNVRQVSRRDYELFIERTKDPKYSESNREHFQEELNRTCVLSEFFDTGSTPLNDSLLLMNYLLPDKQKYMNVDIMNLVVITDGDSNSLEPVALEDSSMSGKSLRLKQEPKKEEAEQTSESLSVLDSFFRRGTQRNEEYYNELRHAWSINNDNVNVSRSRNVYVRSAHSNKIHNFESENTIHNFQIRHNLPRELTRKIVYLLRKETNANILSIELTTANTAGVRKTFAVQFGVYDLQDVDQFISDYRKYGFCSIPDNGYNKIFYVNLHKIGNRAYDRYYGGMYYDEIPEIEEEDAFDNVKTTSTGKLSTRSLANAVEKNSTIKNNRKFLASRVVDVIAERQRKKKKPITLMENSENLVPEQTEEELI